MALIEATSAAVEQARADGTRLSLALVEDMTRDTDALRDALLETAGTEAYTVGSHAAAFLLAGGRAEALGVIARIQASYGGDGRAVELEPGEEAVELLARLLSPKVSD